MYSTVGPRQLVVTLAVILLLVSGCCKGFDAVTAARHRDATNWLHAWTGPYDWTKKSEWRPVQPSHITQAGVLLETKPYVRLSSSQADDLVSIGDLFHENLTPYLVRAVEDAENRWPQEVFVRTSGEIWVGAGANSRCPVPMERRPVVVWLNDNPQDVFVTFVVGR